MSASMSDPKGNQSTWYVIQVKEPGHICLLAMACLIKKTGRSYVGICKFFLKITLHSKCCEPIKM